MEDVLLTYLKSLGQTPAPDRKTAGEPASWTGSSDNSAFLKPGLDYPASALVSLVEAHKEYPASSREVAEFFKKIIGHYPLEEVMTSVCRAKLPRVWMERFLLILLEVEPSDWQTAAYALQFRHLKRLLFRVDRQKPLNINESGLARELIQALGLTCLADLEDHCRQAQRCFRSVQGEQPQPSADLGLLVYLLRCEGIAMGERKNWLERELSGNDPENIARLTPHLKLLEDRMQRAQELARRLGSYAPLQDGPMGLETAMGPFFFAHLRESLAKVPGLTRLKETLELQQAKRIPTRDLIALSTLCRWRLEARREPSGPLDWMHTALASYDHGHFRVCLEGCQPALASLLAEAQVDVEGTAVLGNFGENPYSSWVARDELTRPYHSPNPDRIMPDIRATVLANIHRDAILIKLLDNAKVYETAGIVETIVETSRSPAVHTKIATRNELHSGSVNICVAVALLKSPVSIPTAIIRTLIHSSRISLAELKSLYRGRSSLRAEVADEITRHLQHARII